MVVNGRAVMFEANKKHKGWRDHVSTVIPKLEQPSTNPVRVELLFYFNKPKTVKREHMSVKPDIDKLTRSVLDALTLIAWKDDSQVVKLEVAKLYAHDGPEPGVRVRVVAA